MRAIMKVSADTIDEYVDAMNEAYAELSRFEIIKEKNISDTTTIITYETPKELDTVEEDIRERITADYDVEFPDAKEKAGQTVRLNLRVGKNEDRRCCECDNYNWGKNCPYRDGHIRRMDRACGMFNIVIEARY